MTRNEKIALSTAVIAVIVVVSLIIIAIINVTHQSSDKMGTVVSDTAVMDDTGVRYECGELPFKIGTKVTFRVWNNGTETTDDDSITNLKLFDTRWQ